MLLPTFLSATALAWTANAFLLPLELANKANPDFKGLSDDVADKFAHAISGLESIQSKAQTVRLDCSSCPFALNSERHGHHEWTSNVDSELELKFTTESGRLSLNGVPFYPISSPPRPQVLSVKQIQKETGDTSAKKWEGYHGDLALSYSLEIENKQAMGKEAGSLASIVLTVLGLEEQMIKVDDIKIKVVEFNDKRIIHSVTTVPASPDSPDAKCTTIFCRVLSKLRSTMRKAKSAAQSASHTAAKKVKICCLKCMQFFRGATKHHGHKGLPTHIRVKPGHTNHPAKFNHPANVNHPVHSTHHAHMHHHSWLRTLIVVTKRVFSFILFPILIGLAFGATASAVGILVGRLLVFLWMRSRRSAPGVVAYERLEADEKDGLPAYEDVEGVDVEAEKEAVQKV